MRKLLLAITLATGLTACTIPTAPAIYSAKAVITADAAYVAASRAGQYAVIAGKLDKARFQALDARAYAALSALQEAQKVIGSPDAFTASIAFSTAIQNLYAAAGTKPQ